MAKSQLITALIVLLIAGGVGYYGYRTGNKTATKSTTASKEVAPGRPYQAVFLTNGQAYFGKVTGKSTNFTTLKDIYYLQVQQPLQPADQKQQPQIQLVKLGNELHKPKDEMQINNQHILFVEDIQEDGQVVTAIRQFQTQQSASSGAATSSTQTTPAGTAPESTTKK